MTPPLAAWLSGYDWDTMATWTFGRKWPNGPSPEAVRRHVLPWVDACRCERALVVAECGQSGQRRWHAHGLLGPSPMGRQAMWSDWSRRYGRCLFTRLDGTRLDRAAAYCAKYCAKGTISSDWWWIRDGGSFRA